ncbi:hypothetical protein L596_021836 [Steinernema carpocapsae]|uniref:C2H2-type domain-containing protein n=1 Tax=Steinernema carpocapsae TaxID=34508 RepID=A0A4U5MJX7_STECR|nr:hypothetical protein L596_021836 [Steinernema carpocapsae]
MLRQLLLSPTAEDVTSTTQPPATVNANLTTAVYDHPQQQPLPPTAANYGYAPGPPYDAAAVAPFNSVSSHGMQMQQHSTIGTYPTDLPIKVETGAEYAIHPAYATDAHIHYGYPQTYPNQSLSGIPEMFSSTYAVLSGDQVMADNNNWNYYQSGYPSENLGYYQPADYQNWNAPHPQHPWGSCIQQENVTPVDPYHDFSNDSGISSMAHDGSPPICETTTTVIPENEKVLCINCKGLYPSKRSLTGHIGRSDLCRDSIIHKCLATPPAGEIQADEALMGKFTSICPFCDKFVSNFKVNIRRHLTMCSKSPHKAGGPTPQQALQALRKNAAKLKSAAARAPSVESEIPAPPAPPVEVVAVPPPQPTPQPRSAPAPKKTSNTNNVDDPYICSYCTFVTVYKGNMKRHLGSCHQMSDEQIKETGGLDVMRSSARDPNAPAPVATSARSYRGRKPKNQNS